MSRALLGYDGFEVACLHSKIAPWGIEHFAALVHEGQPQSLLHSAGALGGDAAP